MAEGRPQTDGGKIVTGQQTLEPVGRRDRTLPVKVSLRGSLAAEYYRLLTTVSADVASSYMRELFQWPDPDIVRLILGDDVIIGLRSEQGNYLLDW